MVLQALMPKTWPRRAVFVRSPGRFELRRRHFRLECRWVDIFSDVLAMEQAPMSQEQPRGAKDIKTWPELNMNRLKTLFFMHFHAPFMRKVVF